MIEKLGLEPSKFGVYREPGGEGIDILNNSFFYAGRIKVKRDNSVAIIGVRIPHVYINTEDNERSEKQDTGWQRIRVRDLGEKNNPYRQEYLDWARQHDGERIQFYLREGDSRGLMFTGITIILSNGRGGKHFGLRVERPWVNED